MAVENIEPDFNRPMPPMRVNWFHGRAEDAPPHDAETITFGGGGSWMSSERKITPFAEQQSKAQQFDADLQKRFGDVGQRFTNYDASGNLLIFMGKLRPALLPTATPPVETKDTTPDHDATVVDITSVSRQQTPPEAIIAMRTVYAASQEQVTSLETSEQSLQEPERPPLAS